MAGGNPLALGIDEMAEVCGVSGKTLRRAIDRGELPVVCIGSRRVLRVAVVEKWLMDHEEVAPCRPTG